MLPRNTSSDVFKNDYLLGKLENAAQVNLPADQKQYLVNLLGSGQSAKVLYHATKALVSLNSENASLATLTLTPKIALIANTASNTYAMQFLNLVRNTLNTDQTFLVNFATALMNHKDQSTAALAACTLVENNTLSVPGTKEKVIVGLSVADWSIRRSSLNALNKMKSTPEDSDLLVNMLLDRDSDVRAAANTVVGSLAFTNHHLPVLQQLVNHSDWSLRAKGIQLVNRIPTHEATAMLITRLSDSDSDVRKAANAAVGPRLTEQDMPLIQDLVNSANNDARLQIVAYLSRFKTQGSQAALTKLTSDSGWDIRRAAIYALSDFSGDAVTNVLLAKFADSDSDVKAAAIAAIAKRPLSNAQIPQLTVMSKSNDWSVRRQAIQLAARIETPEATAVIISKLADSDTDVIKAAQSLLNSRNLGDAELSQFGSLIRAPQSEGRLAVLNRIAAFINQTDGRALTAIRHLTQMTNDSDWSIRRAAVQALATSNRAEATASIIQKLFDSDSDVQKAVRVALENRTLNDQHISSLESALNHSDWSVRVYAANLLGKTSSKVALKMLTDRLGKETDSDALKAIASAVASVSSRVN